MNDLIPPYKALFRHYKDFEGKKQFSREDHYEYVTIGLYITGKQVDKFNIDWSDYEELKAAACEAGFTYGYLPSQIRARRKRLDIVQQEFDTAWEARIEVETKGNI